MAGGRDASLTDGHVTIVGGGTGALGRAVVARLSAQRRRIVVPAREPDSSPPPGVTAVRCDLSKSEEVDALASMVGGMGRLTALVNCSGGFAAGVAHELGDEAMLAQLELNLLGPWRLSRLAARAMLDAGTGGRIVTVVGRAAAEVSGGQAAYQVSKTAAARLVQVMAVELRDHGITVNAVLPGTMDTPANRAAMPSADHARWVPVTRVADAIAWLLSPEAEAVSGALLPIYGRT